MGAVAENLPLSGFIIVLLLIAQFNSFKKPGIVLMTITIIFGLLFATVITLIFVPVLLPLNNGGSGLAY